MKNSEAFKFGILFNMQAADCIANKTHTGLLTNPNYPPEIQELAKVFCFVGNVIEGVADAEQLICSKLDEEPADAKQLEKLLLLVLKGQKNSVLLEDALNHLDRVAVTERINEGQAQWLIEYGKIITEYGKIITEPEEEEEHDYECCIKCLSRVMIGQEWIFQPLGMPRISPRCVKAVLIN